jgi:hypothetical protein
MRKVIAKTTTAAVPFIQQHWVKGLRWTGIIIGTGVGILFVSRVADLIVVVTPVALQTPLNPAEIL